MPLKLKKPPGVGYKSRQDRAVSAKPNFTKNHPTGEAGTLQKNLSKNT